VQRRIATICVLATIAIIAAGGATAQTKREEGEIRSLKLGMNAQSMTMDDWSELACGSNGGPPRQQLDAWSDFKTCRPEASGLREVAARFDDEAEYVGKALGNPSYTAQNGTRVSGHPVILSALFDDSGVLRGIRAISDPRANPVERRMAHLLGIEVINHYGTEGWKCTDTAPAEGETPVGGVFIKQRCEKLTPERAMTVETHFLRKPGQSAINPETQEYTRGEFESWTRFELFDPAYRKP
jgi:hypothetical protein